MRCLDCDYDLSGLTEHRCPECGRGFDPNDIRTFRSDPWFERRCGAVLRKARWCACFPAIVLFGMTALTCLAVAVDGKARPDVVQRAVSDLLTVSGAVIALSVFMMVVLLGLAIARSWDGGWMMRKRALAATIVIVFSGSLLVVIALAVAAFMQQFVI